MAQGQGPEPQNGRNQPARGEARQGAKPQGGEQGLARGGGAQVSRGGAGAATQSPFGFVRRMFEDMDRLFGEFGIAPSGFAGFAPGMAAWAPQLELFEEGDKLVVRADLPGLRKEDVEIELQDDVLVISGERREEKRDEREGYFRSERSYGRFERAIRVPEGTDPATCEARFDQGVLEIRLQKPREQERGRKIPIQASSETVSEEKAAKKSG